MTVQQNNETSALETQSNTELEHAETEQGHSESGPHIPSIQGETVFWFISNTTLTTILFLAIISLVSYHANKALKSSEKSKVKLFFLSFVKFFDTYLRDSLGDKQFARKYYSLVTGVFIIVFFWNILGLLIDWLWSSISPTILSYLRPMHSDLNTTLVLATITLIVMLWIGVKTHGSKTVIKSYLFNFHGETFIEKCVGVFVGWLHFIGLAAMVASLSLRLFWNIFAGVVLLWVITYLLWLASQSFFELGKIVSIPFWFFEIGVSLVQAIVFSGLMIAYFKNAKAHH